jgi:hypothetical protein
VRKSNRYRPPSPPTASLPVPSQAQARTWFSTRIRVAGCPVATSQIRTVPSAPAVASQLPSADHQDSQAE